VDEDANTVWGIITDLTGSEEEVTVDGEATTVGDFAMGKLNGLAEEGNQAIYDNAWTNADALTPWTHPQHLGPHRSLPSVHHAPRLRDP
jgi:hypothetical protein